MKFLVILVLLLICQISFGQHCPQNVAEFNFIVNGPVSDNQIVGKTQGCDPDFGQSLYWEISDGNSNDLWLMDNGFILVKNSDDINTQGSVEYVITVKLTDDGFPPLSSITIINIAIYQKNHIICYPNPFTDFVTFEYMISEDSHVSLNLFDIQGKLIDVIIDENQLSGKHSIEYSNTKLTTGVYTYKIFFDGDNSDYIYYGKIIKKRITKL